jgi:hypothetical protein
MCLSRWLYVAPPFHNVARTEKTRKKKRLLLYFFKIFLLSSSEFYLLSDSSRSRLCRCVLTVPRERGKKREDLTHDRNPYRVLLLTSLILEREREKEIISDQNPPDLHSVADRLGQRIGPWVRRYSNSTHKTHSSLSSLLLFNCQSVPCFLFWRQTF